MDNITKEKIDQNMDFAMNVNAFFFKNPDVYSRYMKFYWGMFIEKIKGDQPSIDNLTELKKGIESDIIAFEKQQGLPPHIINSGISEMKDVISFLNLMIIKVK